MVFVGVDCPMPGGAVPPGGFSRGRLQAETEASSKADTNKNIRFIMFLEL
jgi:hypothetical protein